MQHGRAGRRVFGWRLAVWRVLFFALFLVGAQMTMSFSRTGADISSWAVAMVITVTGSTVTGWLIAMPADRRPVAGPLRAQPPPPQHGTVRSR
jgi:hypothetical protein